MSSPQFKLLFIGGSTLIGRELKIIYISIRFNVFLGSV